MRKILIFLICAVFLINITHLVSAKEYTLIVGGSVTFNDKTITLQNVGSSGAIVIDIDGIVETINGIKDVNNIEIVVVQAFYVQDKADRSAIINLAMSGEVCYEDNYCDFKKIYARSGESHTYRGKLIKIIETIYADYSIKLEVDGTTKIIPDIWDNLDGSTDIINGIGIKNIGDFDLFFGENFANCPNDCPLDEKGDEIAIRMFCSNDQKDAITNEEDIDCGGLCERNCKCAEHHECRYLCEIDKKTMVQSCVCEVESGECINANFCKKDSDCIKINDDCCGCKPISINKDYQEYWTDQLNEKCRGRSCLRECNFNNESKCIDNKCSLTDAKISTKETQEIIKEAPKEENITKKIVDKKRIEELNDTEINIERSSSLTKTEIGFITLFIIVAISVSLYIIFKIK